jgi:hypothetical protein
MSARFGPDTLRGHHNPDGGDGATGISRRLAPIFRNLPSAALS